MPTTDPVASLVHDHMALNQRLLELAKLIDRLRQGEQVEGGALLHELRETLFLHFAREEEGLFPFVVEAMPELSWQVQSMAAAHDGICGGLSRLLHMLATGAEPAAVLAVFERFERAYGEHARSESALLAAVDQAATPAQRAQLAELVAGL